MAIWAAGELERNVAHGIGCLLSCLARDMIEKVWQVVVLLRSGDLVGDCISCDRSSRLLSRRQTIFQRSVQVGICEGGLSSFNLSIQRCPQCDLTRGAMRLCASGLLMITTRRYSKRSAGFKPPCCLLDHLTPPSHMLTRSVAFTYPCPTTAWCGLTGNGVLGIYALAPRKGCGAPTRYPHTIYM